MKSGIGVVAAPQSPSRGVVAALVVLALVMAVAAPPRPASADSLLVNGSLESYFTYATDPGTGTPLTLASGWTAFVQSGNPYFMSVRDFAVSPWGTGWVEGFEGENNQMIFTPDGPGAFVAGLSQRVTGVTPGTAYAFSGRILTLGFDPKVTKELGIDPWGGTDPASPNVEWGFSALANQADAWQNVYMAALAKSSALTVFIRVKHPLVIGPGNSEVFLDAFVLDVAPLAHTVALSPFRTDPSIPVAWALDWKPPDTLFDITPTWFEVQARAGSGPWQFWLPNAHTGSSVYAGQDCHTYYFQSRAVVMHPMISNTGSRLPSYWPGGEGQTHTSVISAPPTSQVNGPAETQQCNQFPVTWSGSAGSCGINGYDVQVRDGAGGSWTDWLAGALGTQATFRGADGHTYGFRSRARGFGGYLEAYDDSPDAKALVALAPPVASISPLPTVQVTTTVPITWNGGAAGCGIGSYDVFTRSVALDDDRDSGWQPWLIGTQSVGASFVGQFNTYYAFRVRARDTAGNWSEASTATTVLSAPRSVLAASSLVVEPALAHAGETVSYHLWVSNTGGLSSTAWVTQTLPVAHTTLLTETVQASQGAPQVLPSGITWSGILSPGTSVVITAEMRLDESVGRGTYVTSSAQIRDGSREPFWRSATVLTPYQAYLPVVAAGSP
jgi:hypothetical protein